MRYDWRSDGIITSHNSHVFGKLKPQLLRWLRFIPVSQPTGWLLWPKTSQIDIDINCGMTQSQIKICVAGLHILLVLLKHMSWIFLGDGDQQAKSPDSIDSVNSLHLLLLRILLPALCLPSLRDFSIRIWVNLELQEMVKTNVQHILLPLISKFRDVMKQKCIKCPNRRCVQNFNQNSHMLPVSTPCLGVASARTPR